MDNGTKFLLVTVVRIGLLALFLISTFSLTLSWKSFITFGMFADDVGMGPQLKVPSNRLKKLLMEPATPGLQASMFILPLKPKTSSTKETKEPKTRDLLKELYPPVPDEIQERELHDAIYKLVSYDPTSVPALDNFQPLQQNSNCKFAKKARIWGTPQWNASLSVEENVYRFLPMLLKFTIVCLPQKLDGFLIELPGEIFGSSVQDFGDGLRDVLTSISDHDPAKIRCMNKSYIGKRGWVFEFNRCTFFITTFAPFYPETHPRYAFGAKNCYIMLQPELSFAFHDLPEDSVETNWEDPQNIREKIRVAFREAGRPYYIPESIYSPMAHEILRPIQDSDPLYEWWVKKEHRS